MSVKRMTLIAMMTCLMAVCSWITIPAVVPFTMQTFAVFSALLLLGGKSGLISIALYVLLGCIGVPVFSGFQGGIWHIIGPTGGYIIGFIFTAIFYLLFEPLYQKKDILKLPILAGGLFLCYFIGTVWFRTIYEMRGTAYSIGAVISLCVLPYIIPDVIKLVLAWIISKKIRKAIPDLR
ncbi:MAG: biotin transporter BioY [Lachnospiraceae bacterium]|nr:biotin transporter BioY [Lachnospiraceae bacterium]